MNVELDEKGLLLACPDCGQRNRLVYERFNNTFRCGKCQTELRGPAEPVTVDSMSEFAALTGKAAVPVLVDFWAPWCGPCKMVAPELEKVAREGAGRWIVAKVNTEDLPAIAQQFSIAGIPTFIVFGNGAELTRQSGAMPAQRLRQLIEQAQFVHR
jgi:thioredoxin 2